ncbi:DUF4393 domain-containing protein [Actinoplanes sp. CA-030573]|uniref:DUF4393 domain-containing protein n=1 Tax=Actinoplanes sp. CA-030573 TaxID=3239898 RepID=UPI003D8BF33D
MNGSEIAAAGKVVGAAVNKALSPDEETNKSIVALAAETAEMKAAARTRGARVALVERVKLKLWYPVARLFGESAAYFEDAFVDEMAAKTADIPSENMVTPPPSVLVPTMQVLSYIAEEPDLKELYLNLLTTASDDRRNADAHPAFAQVIKELTASEANLLNTVLAQEQWPIVRVENTVPGGYQVKMMHLTPFRINGEGSTQNSLIPTWIDNWVRLGLVDATYAEHAVNEAAYEWVTTSPDYVRIGEMPDVDSITFTKGLIRRNAFAERFYRAVSPPVITSTDVGNPPADAQE